MDAGGTDRYRAEKQRSLLTFALLIAGTVAVSPSGWQPLGFPLLLLPMALMAAAFAAVVSIDPGEGALLHAAEDLRQRRAAVARTHALAYTPVRTVDPLAAGTDLARDAERTRRRLDHAEELSRQTGIRFGCAGLDDDEFLRELSAGQVRIQDFRHGDHLRLAWLLVHRMPYALAHASIERQIRALLQRYGAAAQFHATRTEAWIRLVAFLPERTLDEAIAVHGRGLLRSASLEDFYSPELLNSEAARSRVAETDRAPLPPVRPSSQVA